MATVGTAQKEPQLGNGNPFISHALPNPKHCLSLAYPSLIDAWIGVCLPAVFKKASALG